MSNFSDKIVRICKHDNSGRTMQEAMSNIFIAFAEEIDSRLPSKDSKRERCNKIRDEILSYVWPHVERRTKPTDPTGYFTYHGFELSRPYQPPFTHHACRRSERRQTPDYHVWDDRRQTVYKHQPVSTRHTQRRIAERRVVQCSVFDGHNHLRRNAQRRGDHRVTRPDGAPPR